MLLLPWPLRPSGPAGAPTRGPSPAGRSDRSRVRRLLHTFESCFPLRGKWLACAFAAALGMFWLLGAHAGWGAFTLRTYLVSSPARPYPWHEPVKGGGDCQYRMRFTGYGEITRS